MDVLHINQLDEFFQILNLFGKDSNMKGLTPHWSNTTILARKMEANQPSHFQRAAAGSMDAYRERYRRYPVPTGRVAILEDKDLFPTNPEAVMGEPPELDQLEGLSLHMMQVMGHF